MGTVIENNGEDEIKGTFDIPIEVTPELLALIESEIAKMRPAVLRDGGDIRLVKVERGIVRIALDGACTHCHLAGQTLGGLRRRLMQATGLPLRVAPFVK